MQVKINSRNLNPSQALRDKIEGKLSKLDKYFSKDAEASVMLSEVKTGLAKLEATITAGGMSGRVNAGAWTLMFGVSASDPRGVLVALGNLNFSSNPDNIKDYTVKKAMKAIKKAGTSLEDLLKKSGRSNLFSVARSATIVYNPF